MSAPLTLDQVDELLRAWDERLRRMDENLVALEGEAIYQILAGKAGKRMELEGVTKERVAPALDAVNELFENRERLGRVVAKAKEVRGSISTLTFWDTDEKLIEVFKLLRRPSIELGPQVVALSERSLLDVSTKDVLLEPERLLADMVKAFERARTVLLSVSRGWESLDPTMTEIEKEMTSLRELAAELAPKDPQSAGPQSSLVELTSAEEELAVLRRRVQKDPLGAGEGIGKALLPRLSALRARLVAERAAKERVVSMIERARALLRCAAEAHERAVAAEADTAREIALAPGGPATRAVDIALHAGLEQWLGKLEAAVHNRRWSSAEVGLARWVETAEQYRVTNERAFAEARNALSARDELLGRLSARRAQAAALAAKGLILDRSLDAVAKHAEELLRVRPTPLADVMTAVTTFEAAVVAASGRR